jgi:hypothetical protein
MPGKRVQFDDETWGAVDLLARDRMMDFQELADEAFRDILKKYDRPTELVKALRKSAETAAPKTSTPTIDPSRQPRKQGARGAKARRKRRSAA